MKQQLPVLLSLVSLFAMQMPAPCPNITSPSGYIRFSPGMFQPTEEQVMRISTLDKTQIEQLKRLYAPSRQKISDLTRKISRARTAELKSIKTILSAEQYSLFEKDLLDRHVDLSNLNSNLSRSLFKCCSGDIERLNKTAFLDHDTVEQLKGFNQEITEIRIQQLDALEKILTTAQLIELQNMGRKNFAQPADRVK